MKRGKKQSNDEPVVSKEFVKSTYLLHPVVKENLQFIALAEKTEQTDLVRKAIEELIRDRGLDPMVPPKYELKKAVAS